MNINAFNRELNRNSIGPPPPLPKTKKQTIWQLRGFWQDRSVRENGAQLCGTRARPIVSRNSRIFNCHDLGTLGTSLHHQIPPNTTPPHSTRRFHLMLWRSQLMLWRSQLLGVPSYWAFPWRRRQAMAKWRWGPIKWPGAPPWERPVTGNAQ